MTQTSAFALKSHLSSGEKPTIYCQDYALADDGLVIVCDGVSTLRLNGEFIYPESHVGAWMQANAARAEILSDTIRSSAFLPNLLNRMKMAVIALDAKFRDLHATLLCAKAHADGGITIRVFGDGAVAFKYRDGSIHILKYEWTGMVFNPITVRDGVEAFVESYGGSDQIALKIHHYMLGDKGLVLARTDEVPVSQAVKGTHVYLAPKEVGSIDMLMLTSDGPSQVEGMEWEQVMLFLLNDLPRNRKGLAQKQLQRLQSKGVQFLDDMSCAFMVLEEEGQK